MHYSLSKHLWILSYVSICLNVFQIGSAPPTPPGRQPSKDTIKNHQSPIINDDQKHSCTHTYTPKHTGVSLTFDCDLGGGLDHAEGGNGHAGVVGRLADVGELQHVAAHGHLLLLGQLLHAAHPLHIRHGSADRHAGQVDAAAGHHLVIGGGDGEAGRHTANCRGGLKKGKMSKFQGGREGRGGITGPLD